MVKGVSRQVIVVRPPDKRMFEQAIFILHEGAESAGITDQMLLQEAKKAAREMPERHLPGPVWACGGALAMGILWLITALA